MVRLLNLERGAHVELAVEPLVVPRSEVLERREFDLLDGSPGSAQVDQLGRVEAVDGRGEGVVERVADGPGRGFRAEVLDPVRVDDGEVV